MAGGGGGGAGGLTREPCGRLGEGGKREGGDKEGGAEGLCSRRGARPAGPTARANAQVRGSGGRGAQGVGRDGGWHWR